MVKIFGISGDGIGAGKTSFARKIGEQVWSLAGALREELKRDFPNYDWHNKSQEYKAQTRVPECGNKVLRQVMIERGQERCAEDPIYWVRKLGERLKQHDKYVSAALSVAIDDIRKVSEIEYLKEIFPSQVIHFHLITPSAIREKEFENDRLRTIADYHISWEY